VGCGIFVKKERECGITTPPPPLPNPASKKYTEKHEKKKEKG